jgi:hypothetical protein
MRGSIILMVFLVSGFFSFSQLTISGKVRDASTKQPLQGASVYAQNTTKGTTTDSEGYFFLTLGDGAYDIIFSFVGYTSKRVVLQDSKSFILELSRADNVMANVVVAPNRVQDGWKVYGDLFLKQFLGNTLMADSCKLLNPEALTFLYFKNINRLKVLTSEPLQISNRGLGYTMQYDLDSFTYDLKKEPTLTTAGAYIQKCTGH